MLTLLFLSKSLIEHVKIELMYCLSIFYEKTLLPALTTSSSFKWNYMVHSYTIVTNAIDFLDLGKSQDDVDLVCNHFVHAHGIVGLLLLHIFNLIINKLPYQVGGAHWDLFQVWASLVSCKL